MDKRFIIEIENMSKIIKNQTILNNINICFERGKIHGISGRNGSGKTVLLKCICGLMKATTGFVAVNGKKVGLDVDFPQDVGFIIENPGFLSNYSGIKNLRYLASIKNLISEQDIRNSMILVGLDYQSKKHVGKYSLGMRQRLGLAQAVMENPELLVLDEPLNSLDKEGVQEMHKLFKQLREKGKTILIASHNRYDIEDLCDTVIELDAGKLINISCKKKD